MQFTTLLATSVLAFASGISAIPNPFREVTVTIYNDVTGANSQAIVLNNNVPRPLVDLLGADSSIAKGGFVATSAQLTQFQDGTKCALVDAGRNWRVELDGRSKNFVDLDGTNVAVPVYVGGFTFQCTN